MKSILALSVVLVPALAATPLGRTVFARQQASCSDIGEKPCGDGCVPLTYTCCPDKKGGCPVTSVCQLADNGVYGCCPIGRTCSGDATATTNTIDVTKTNTNTVTNTLTETQPTETQPTETLPTETQPTETESETPSATLPGTVTSVPVPTGNGTAPPATTSLPPVTAGAASNGLPAVGGILAGVVAFLF